MASLDELRRNLITDWDFLGRVYDILRDEKAFCISETNRNNEKIVNFVPPDELKQLIDLSIEAEVQQNPDQLEEICRQVIKYSVKTSHGRFHNQLFGQLDPYGLAGTWISEALNTSAYTFEVAPVFSLIETEVLRKVCEISGYELGDGIFSPGGSISNMYGLVLARYKRYPNVKSTGVFGMRPLVLFTSEESHYSLRKAAHWLGLGIDNCILIKTNEQGQMIPEHLEAEIERVRAEGREPFFVNATAGTTVLGAFDNFNAIADICDRQKLWLHVDACLGGTLLLSHKYRHLLDGLERSNSFSWNPHKTLGAPLQCAMFLTREQKLLAQCNSLEVNYLFQQDKFYDISYDTGNKSVQCGRKIDAFKFWLMLKARGYNNIGHIIDHVMDMARLFAMKIKERGCERFRLIQSEFQYTNVCFWYIPRALRGQDESTKEWKERLNAVAPKVKEQMAHSGTLMIGYSPLLHRGLGNFFRMVFSCYPILDEAELDFTLDEIERLSELCNY